MVKYIKRSAPGEPHHAKGKGGSHITEADLERISAEAPVPDRVGATCSANAAIQRINCQYEINQLREEVQGAQAPVSASFPSSLYTPSPLYTTSSNILARQLGGPTVNYEPVLPVSATSQVPNVAPPAYSSDLLEAYNLQQVGSGLPATEISPQVGWNGVTNSDLLEAYNLQQLGSGLPAPAIPPRVGWEGVTNALLQAFQAAQAQRRHQDHAQYAQLTLLANAIAADSQNTQSRLTYPPLTPSRLGAFRSAVATLSSVPNIPSTIYAPTWVPGTVQQQNLAVQQLQQQAQRQQQRDSNFYDGTNLSHHAEPDDEDENEQNYSE